MANAAVFAMAQKESGATGSLLGGGVMELGQMSCDRAQHAAIGLNLQVQPW
jgi:hypothetical protein